MMPNPAESPPSSLGGLPPDRSEGTLQYHAMKVLEIVGRDGIIADDEKRVVGALVQGLSTIAQGRMQQGQPPMAGNEMLAAAGGPQAPPAETEPYGGVAGGAPLFPE